MATRKKIAVPANEPLVERDFVHLGVREGNDRKLIKVMWLDTKVVGRTTQRTEVAHGTYAATARSAARTVGGIYRGAKHGERSAAGIDGHLTYQGKWHNTNDLVQWEAEHAAALAQYAAQRMEKADKRGYIETQMLDLRRVYHNADYATQIAMDRAVLLALRTAPRADEI